MPNQISGLLLAEFGLVVPQGIRSIYERVPEFIEDAEMAQCVVWQNTQADFQMAFARLKAAGAPEEVIELCSALSSQGLALEHESVWLCISSPLGET